MVSYFLKVSWLAGLTLAQLRRRVATRANEAKQPIRAEILPTLNEEGPIMTLAEEQTLAQYLRSVRTSTQEDVNRIGAQHDADDLSPVERAAFDTGSIRRVQ